MPTVSVIIPVLNCEKYLPQCIESVLSSTLDDVEVIVVDDGSTDRSASIAESYEGVTTIRKSHSGCGGARNAGLDVSTGKYVYFLDSDDYISSSFLESIFRKAEADQLDGLLFNMTPIYESDEIERTYATAYDSRYQLIERNRVIDGRKMFAQLMKTNEYRAYVQRQLWRREFLVENDCVFPKSIGHQDESFTMCAILSSQRIECIDEDGLYRRYREGSIVVSTNPVVNYYDYFITYCVLARLALDRFGDIPEAKVLPIRIFLTMVANKGGFEAFPDAGLFPDEDYLDAYAGYLLYKEISEGIESVDDEQLARIKKADAVYLYGAGNWGGRMHRLLAANDIAVERVIVTDVQGNPLALNGTKIVGAQEALPGIVKASSVIVVCMMGAGEELTARLKAEGFDAVWCGDLVNGEVLV